jgi:hypothetical protein
MKFLPLSSQAAQCLALSSFFAGTVTTITATGGSPLRGGSPMMCEWHVCMFWGAAIVFLVASFFFVCLYAASALDDMKSALGVMKHD